jgi:hypothetical protein
LDKQWGTWGEDGLKTSKKANGRVLLGQEWNEEPKTQRAAWQQSGAVTA